MKIVAHRGWAAGAAENTPAAFRRAAADPRISGVELDVRRSTCGRLIVSHDAAPPGADTLSLDAALELLTATGLEVIVELKQHGIGAEVTERLRALGLSGRATVFGFPDVMDRLPRQPSDGPRTGIIVTYPWQARRLVRAFDPDVLLLGWDERAWTRTAFRAWWSLFSLRRLGHRYGAAVIVGVAQRPADLRWLRRQGVEAAVADMLAPEGADGAPA